MSITTEGVRFIISLQDQFSAQVQAANNNAKQFEAQLGSIDSALDKMKQQAAAAFGIYQTIEFAKDVVNTGAKYEAAQVGLETLLKSGEKAQEVMEQIKKDAQTTPFDTESLLMANRALISTGLSAETARKDVLNLANAIAANGGGNDELSRMVVNMQQIKNTGKATALDIKQFAYAGINIYGLLADATGKSKEEVKDLEVSYELLSQALNKAHEAGGLYEGGLERMAQTTQVQISNLGDAWEFFKDDLFKLNKEAVDSTLAFGQSTIKTLKEVTELLYKNANLIKTAAAAIAGAIAVYAVWNAAIKLNLWYHGLSTAAIIVNTLATEGFTAAVLAANIALAANPVGLVAVAVAGLAAAWMAATAAHEAYIDSIDQRANDAVKEEIKLVSELTRKYQEQGMAADEAKAKAISGERARLEKEIADTRANIEKAKGSDTVYMNIGGLNIPIGKTEGKKQVTDLQQKLTKLMAAKAELAKPIKIQGAGLGGVTDGTSTNLGSELNTPKASAIRNVTININSRAVEVNVTSNGGLGDALDEDSIKGVVSKWFASLVTDSAIIATE